MKRNIFLVTIAFSILIFACNENKPVEAVPAKEKFSIAGTTEEVLTKHPDGTTKQSIFYDTIKHQKLALVEFHPNGTAYIDRRFVNDTLNGESWSYYPDGKPWSLNNFKNGKYEGPYKTWHSSGQLNIEGFYIAGEEHGEWFTYYPSGKINTRGRYNMGVKTGVWSAYSEDGKLTREENFSTN